MKSLRPFYPEVYFQQGPSVLVAVVIVVFKKKKISRSIAADFCSIIYHIPCFYIDKLFLTRIWDDRDLGDRDVLFRSGGEKRAQAICG